MAIFQTFFLGKIGEENVFFDHLERKKRLSRLLKLKFKTGKSDILPKGLTHGFGPKMSIFQTFFLGKIGKENVFSDHLERKKRLSRL